MDTMPTLEETSQLPTFPLTVRRKMVGFKQRLAERIVEAREQQGWDQRELAFRAQISDKTLQRLELGQVDKPRPSTLRKIAEAVGRDVADIRPDMETEERSLRSQLDRIEKNEVVVGKLDEILNQFEGLTAALALLVPALEQEPASQPPAKAHKSRKTGTRRGAGRAT